MTRTAGKLRPIVAAVAIACGASVVHADGFTWQTIVNNGELVPGTTDNFNSYNQPAVNNSGMVVFRARGRVLSGGGEGEEPLAVTASARASGATMVTEGIFQRDMSTLGPVTKIATRGDAVPQPNNTYYNGALAGFTEFASSPRIDFASALIATRGQSQPVYTYLAADGVTETRIGTSGVFANPGGTLMTGVGLFGAVMEVQPDLTYGLTFPHHAVPDALPGTRFDVFPGSPSPTGTVVAFKGNWTDPDGISRTGAYYRDLLADGGKSPVKLIAGTGTVIPNQPAGGTVKFGATANPSAANGYAAFTGWDIEEAPTLGGVYRVQLVPGATLQTLAGIGDPVPGEPEGSTFKNFSEGLSMSEDGRYVAFWATWGTESVPKFLPCPIDGEKNLIAYCNTTYPAGFTAQVPVHQGIFVADAQTGKVTPIAKAGADGMVDFIFWTFSGSPPGTSGGGSGDSGSGGAGGGDSGGDSGGDESAEPPRWRYSAFAALAGKPGNVYGSAFGYSPYQVAFKAVRGGVDGIYLRQGGLTATVETLAETFNTPGQSIDPAAPAGSIVTALGIERDGFRDNKLAIAASMLYETTETSLGWAGLYMTSIPALDMTNALDLSVSQSTQPAGGSVGKDVVFTITAANNGTGAAAGVTVNDTLPRDATFIWASPGCTGSGNTVTCDVGPLAPGNSASMKVVVRPTAAGSIGNYVRVDGGQMDPDLSNNVHSAVVSVAASPAASVVQRYRLYSPVTMEHLFTTDLNEYNTLGTYTGMWIQEGTAGRVLDNPGSYNGVTATPYYRLYNLSNNWHHWTSDPNEYYTLAEYPWWAGEGVDGYILPASATGTTRLYRLLYPWLGLHHWTIDENEYNDLIANYGWLSEAGSEYVIQ